MEQLAMNEVGFLLSKIQNEVKVLKINYNSFGKYKYRNVEDIQVAIKPILLKHECTITLSDFSFEMCGIPVVRATARFICAYGEIEVTADAGVDIHKKGMDISQAFGTASSYARKYALGGLLLLDDTADADTQPPSNEPKIILKALTDAQIEKAIADGNTDKVLNNVGKVYSVTPAQKRLLEASKIVQNG